MLGPSEWMVWVYGLLASRVPVPLSSTHSAVPSALKGLFLQFSLHAWRCLVVPLPCIDVFLVIHTCSHAGRVSCCLMFGTTARQDPASGPVSPVHGPSDGHCVVVGGTRSGVYVSGSLARVRVSTHHHHHKQLRAAACVLWARVVCSASKR